MRLELCASSIAPTAALQAMIPCFLETLHESLLDARAYEAVGLLNLAVGLRMRYRGEANLYALFRAELLEFFRCKVGLVVGDDAVRGAEPAGYPLEEIDCRHRRLIGHWYRLDPLGEFVDGDQQMRVPSVRRRREWTNHVESPLGEDRKSVV